MFFLNTDIGNVSTVKFKMEEICAPLISIILLSLIFSGNTQSIFEQKACASLYKEKDLKGDPYNLTDYSQVVNFQTEEIVWDRTLSLSVETNCRVTLCNNTYFTGHCQRFLERQNELPSQFETILSGSCICDKVCNCSEIYMKQTSCARAFFNPGCNVCNPFYTELKGRKEFFPDAFNGRISAIKVRDGCNLTIYDEEDFEGEPSHINGTEAVDWNEQIGSYECECTADSFNPKPKPERPSAYPTLIELPPTIEVVIFMLSGNHAGHPGLIAAQKSLRNNRSSKNVYILAIGSTGSGISSIINLLLDNPNIVLVRDAHSTTKHIDEFRIPAPVDALGISNSELRVIDTPGLGSTDGIGEDAKALATLEGYLDNHEELHNRIPNVVLILHKFSDNRFQGFQSNFVKMLRGFDSLRKRITDSKFTNVIFVLSHFCSEVKSINTRPWARLTQFKAAIELYTQFPKPIMIVVGENKPEEHDLGMVNGSYKLPNGDFYPRNLLDKIKFVTSNSGDPIGEAVIRTAFQNSDDFNITAYSHRLRDPNDRRIRKYKGIFIKDFMEIEDTEINRLLTESYKSLNSSLQRAYSDSSY